MSRADPIRKVFADVSGAGKHQPSSAHGIAQSQVAKADICKCSQICEHFEIDPEPRVKETHVHVGSV